MKRNKNFLYVENAERMISSNHPQFYAIGPTGLEFYNSRFQRVSPSSSYMYLSALGYTKEEIKKIDRKI